MRVFQRMMKTYQTNEHVEQKSVPQLRQTYERVTSAAMKCTDAVNSRKPPTKPRKTETWEESVATLTRLARTDHKQFFRRAKTEFAVPRGDENLPRPGRAIRRLMQVSNPWDPTVTSILPSRQQEADPDPPTSAELRKFARVPRKKSPGPDGIPPYLLYILPEESFTVINVVAKRIIKGEMDLAEDFKSQTIAIQKVWR